VRSAQEIVRTAIAPLNFRDQIEKRKSTAKAMRGRIALRKAYAKQNNAFSHEVLLECDASSHRF
jgi:hypothetical protein